MSNGGSENAIAGTDFTLASSFEHLVAHYVHDHNAKIPMPVLGGRTPDELYFGKGTELESELARAGAAARKARVEHNRSVSCGACVPLKERGDEPDEGGGRVR